MLNLYRIKKIQFVQHEFIIYLTRSWAQFNPFGDFLSSLSSRTGEILAPYRRSQSNNLVLSSYSEYENDFWSLISY